MKGKLLLLSLVFLTACSSAVEGDWYESKERAVEAGLKEEGEKQSSLLSVEEQKGETFVFFEARGSLGIASLTEKNGEYRWFRSGPLLDFDVQGETPFATAGVDYEPESGEQIPILYGKIFAEDIEGLTFEDSAEEVKVFEDSSFFYAFPKENSVLDVVIDESKGG